MWNRIMISIICDGKLTTVEEQLTFEFMRCQCYYRSWKNNEYHRYILEQLEIL